MEKKRSSPTLRTRADKIKEFKCKNLIAVIENPDDIRNIGTIIRNVNALGIEKAYIVTNQQLLPDSWEEMRTTPKLNAISASAIKWSFVKVFKDTNSCMDHLEKNGFISAVTSPHMKGYNNVVLHEHDYTSYKKLAIWFGNEGTGISKTAIERSSLCISIPMCGIIESLNLGTSSGIVLYEVATQRRKFQFDLKQKVTLNKARKKLHN
ncbi:MAG: RNA methyltransferase [Rickettsiaceae bacterium]|nr:RNA methyltransferase [Rickettsiaceae bacterium]